MTYFRDAYQKFLANPRNAPLAANASLFYVASSTKFEGADAVISHASRHAGVVKKSEQTINAIESSDSLVLDQETTLDFLDGGGVYLPSLDDSLIANTVVTIPTLHIVHFNAQGEIQQVRIYWDQGVLLKVVGVIGRRNWPLGDPKEQVRLLKSATTASSAPPLAPSRDASHELPARPGSPGKRHIKDPYAADSLSELLSPSKEEAANNRDEPPRPASPGKRHTKDPYAADSLSELLSPSKSDAAVVRPYAPSAKQPAPRDYSDLFIDENGPSTPSKPEKIVAPKAGAKFEGNRIFNNDIDEGQNRVPYKSNPRRFDHFELGAGDDVDEEESRVAYKPNPRRFDHFEIGTGDDEDAGVKTPPPRPHVPKPRRDAEVHFEVTDDYPEDDGERIISSHQNRGNALYNNRIFDDNGAAVPTEKEEKSRPLSVVGQNANRKKDFDPHWGIVDESPEPSKEDSENAKTIPHDRAKAAKMLESNWELYEESPEPVRTATIQRDPRRHNQPSWTVGEDE